MKEKTYQTKIFGGGKQHEYKNVLLCGLMYDTNFGDAIISDTCKYIINNIDYNKKINIEEIDMTGRYDFNKKYKTNKMNLLIKRVLLKICKILKRIAKICKLKRFFNYLDYIVWFFSDEYYICKKYYTSKIINADTIVFVGGGIIKYKYQNLYHYIDFVTKIADKYNISVALNAAGIEGYDDNNIKCKKLVRALNRKCIKMITTRDDINTLHEYVKNNKEIICKKVSDPATFCSEAYNIVKNENSNIIGLGVCREKLFVDNEINYTGDQLLELWKNIINELDKRKMEWKIYTNGLDGDNLFAYKLAKELNINKDKLSIPNTPKELVNIIAGFKGIINTRLHSSIIAFSLQVPSVGLVWNNKLTMFGDSIGYPERFLTIKKFSADIIVDTLELAIKDQYNKVSLIQYRKTLQETLKQYLLGDE